MTDYETFLLMAGKAQISFATTSNVGGSKFVLFKTGDTDCSIIAVSFTKEGELLDFIPNPDECKTFDDFIGDY